jgi:hypothetical protein
MFLRRGLLSAAVLTIGLCPLVAASITYTISGTAGPVLSGSDPLRADGKSGNVVAVVSATLKPKSHTATSATYKLPAGAVKVTLGGKSYTAKASTLKYTFPAAGPDTMVFTAPVTADGVSGTVVGTVSLAKGSFTHLVDKHPQKFTPSPQPLTAATTAGGPGSQIKYTAPIVGTTVLGLSGTASN